MNPTACRSEPLKEGDVFEKIMRKRNQSDVVVRYRRGQLLGRGSFGHCYEVLNMQNNLKSAVKIIPKSSLTKPTSIEQINSQIRIQGELHHENIVRIDQAFQDPQNIYILMQLCHPKNLRNLLKTRKHLSQQQTKYYIHQLAQVLVYLKQHRVLHRDLTLNNIFLGHQMQVKVGDFGIAAKLNHAEETRRSICGTTYFMAPEMLRKKEYSFGVDVWSIGVVMFSLLFGRQPFQSDSITQTYELIKYGQTKMPEKEGVSEEAKDLICRMLDRNVQKRITPHEILTHEFFKPSIPKMLPISIFQAPPTEFSYQSEPTASHPTDQHICYALNNLNLQKLVEIITSTPAPDPNNKSASIKSQGTDKANLATDQSDKKQSGKPSNEDLYQKTIEEGRQQDEIRIVRMADYNDKYGYGYLLSNGSVGVVFNDFSGMLVDAKNENYYSIPSSEDQLVVKFSTASPTKDRITAKKTAIVRHFRTLFSSNLPHSLDSQPQQMVYVSIFKRTGQSTLFRLSNKLIQVLFTDRSEIVISHNTMVFINPQGEQIHEPLSSALNSKNVELVQRVTHTQELVKSLITNNVSHAS